MKSKASSTQVTEIMDYFRIIFKAIRESSSLLEKQVGLSGAQVFVLRQLSLQAKLSINELAEKTKTHQSSVSVVVKKLEERGLVQRKVSETDSRRYEISLSARGAELLTRLPVSVQENLISSIEAMSEADRAQLSARMHQLASQAGLLNGEPATMMMEND